MKRPRPTAPADAPDGTDHLGSEMEWFSVSLQVTNEKLEPAAITALLGKRTESQEAGVPILHEDGTEKHVPRYGRWSRTIKSNQTDEWDVAEVIKTMLADVPASSDVWRNVATNGRIRISVGLSFSADSADFDFDTELIALLAQRQASVWFDIYQDQSEEPNPSFQRTASPPLN